MPPSDELVLEFQNIYEKKTGVKLSFEDAQKCADDLVEAFDVLSKIDYKEKYEK
jgi:hypothetical protein